MRGVSRVKGASGVGGVECISRVNGGGWSVKGCKWG